MSASLCHLQGQQLLVSKLPPGGLSCSARYEHPFFKNLPADIQKNYKKIHQFQSVANDLNSKLCPQ